MKNLTLFVCCLFLMLIFASCGAEAEGSGGPSFWDDLQIEEEVEDDSEFIDAIENEGVGANDQRLFDDQDYIPLIDLAVNTSLIPKNNIQFFYSDYYGISSSKDSYSGIRWININTRYLRDVKRESTEDGVLFVLFHEIAHHKLGHLSFDWGLFKRSDAELECDYYAAYEMRFLDIPFEKCSNTIRAFGNPHKHSDYPDVDERLKKAKEGYDAASTLIEKLRGA